MHPISSAAYGRLFSGISTRLKDGRTDSLVESVSLSMTLF